MLAPKVLIIYCASYARQDALLQTGEYSLQPVSASAAISWQMFSLRSSMVWSLFIEASQRNFGPFKYGDLFGKSFFFL